MATKMIPLVRVHGAPYERGFHHGSQCGDLIRRSLSALLETIAQEASWLGLDGHAEALQREAALRRAEAFLPQMTAYAPQTRRGRWIHIILSPRCEDFSWHHALNLRRDVPFYGGTA